MTPLNKFLAKLILWGSGPIAFIGGLILSAAINMVTSLALLPARDWPNKGETLLVGSFLLVLASATFVLLATRIQPLKSKSDERLWQRDRILSKDEQNRTTVEFVWHEVIDSEGKGYVIQRRIITPFFLGSIFFIAGFALLIYALPIFSEANIPLNSWKEFWIDLLGQFSNK